MNYCPIFPVYSSPVLWEEVTSIIDFGFNQMNLHRIEAYVESENMASTKTLHRLNFIREGRMVDCELKDSKFISLDIYALLSTSGSVTE